LEQRQPGKKFCVSFLKNAACVRAYFANDGLPYGILPVHHARMQQRRPQQPRQHCTAANNQLNNNQKKMTKKKQF
jgi:hypothetical protein